MLPLLLRAEEVNFNPVTFTAITFLHQLLPQYLRAHLLYYYRLRNVYGTICQFQNPSVTPTAAFANSRMLKLTEKCLFY